LEGAAIAQRTAMQDFGVLRPLLNWCRATDYRFFQVKVKMTALKRMAVFTLTKNRGCWKLGFKAQGAAFNVCLTELHAAMWSRGCSSQNLKSKI
jgi:hypothetical protein